MFGFVLFNIKHVNTLILHGLFTENETKKSLSDYLLSEHPIAIPRANAVLDPLGRDTCYLPLSLS